MPYVNMKITPDGVTTVKKDELIAGVTHLLKELLGKDPETTFGVIEVVETEDWAGVGSQSPRAAVCPWSVSA